MYIIEKYRQKKHVLSFEVFPPKKNVSVETMVPALSQIAELKPDFISVTCGAGGSGNTNNTLGVATMIQDKLGIDAMAHLTCISSTKTEMEEQVTRLTRNSVNNVLALRGDLPKDGNIAHDYRYAKDLIAELKERPLCVAATCYPEGHVDCLNLEENITHLKEKQEAGAQFFISQLFFDNRPFLEFWEQAQKQGVTAPISAGIMPMLAASQVKKMIFMCGASLPSAMVKILFKYQDDNLSIEKAGIEYAINQIEDLKRHGVNGIHIYTMNRPVVAKQLMEAARS